MSKELIFKTFLGFLAGTTIAFFIGPGPGTLAVCLIVGILIGIA